MRPNFPAHSESDMWNEGQLVFLIILYALFAPFFVGTLIDVWHDIGRGRY